MEIGERPVCPVRSFLVPSCLTIFSNVERALLPAAVDFARVERTPRPLPLTLAPKTRLLVGNKNMIEKH
jgi:hypothetical protein